MENTTVIRVPPKGKDILMSECKEIYVANYPHRKDCNITLAEMFMEVVTFYRDAEGIIFRPKAQEVESQWDGKKAKVVKPQNPSP
ncbi:MAG: hypothetical protein NTY03_04330 [Candidatus Bathyarchaeota archaeon]|nr:hypothetical protein [Candidatus Bathyarchaeota archaeon]